MKKFYLKYKLETGLSSRIICENFQTIEERYQRYRVLIAGGNRIVGFGVKN